nr:HNH endonuclease family protein [Helicobacter anatolicus]
MPSYESFCEIIEYFDTRKVKYLLFFYTHVCADFKYRIDPKELEVEHILPKQWQNANFNDWNSELHEEFLEQIGNKILLPKRSNIKCIENFFAKKQEFYRNTKHKNLIEVLELGNRKKNNWTKEDITERNKKIYQTLTEFLDFSDEA